MLDDNGKIYLGSGLSGRASVSGRQYLAGDTTKGKLRPHIDQYFFPQGAVHHATNPVGRALNEAQVCRWPNEAHGYFQCQMEAQQYAIGCQRI